MDYRSKEEILAERLAAEQAEQAGQLAKSSMKFGIAASDELGIAYHLIPPDSLRRIAKVFAEGMEKYPGKAINFRNTSPAIENYPWQQERFSHAMDHLLKFNGGDTSEDHLAKVAWFCLVMMEIQRQENNGRQKGDPKK